MCELFCLIKEIIYFGVLDEDSIVYIYKIDFMYNLWMYLCIGCCNLLYSMVIGKVFLVWCDCDEVKQIFDGVEYK